MFKVNDRVLVTDANTSSTTPINERPLYEAIIRKSSLKYIDPITRKILPESKKRGGRGNAKNNLNSNVSPPPDGEQVWCHLIHYNGWNVRHDKWMCEEDNIFEDTPENRQRVGGGKEEEEDKESSSEDEEVEEMADDDKPKDASEIRRQAAKLGWERRKKMLAEKSGSAAVNASGKKMKSKKRSIDEINNEGSSSSSSAEEEEEDLETVYQKNLQLITDACTLPFTLQTKLIDDRDKITKIVYQTPNYHTGDNPSSLTKSHKGITMLPKLPSTMNMIQIMGQYIKDKKQDDLEELANDSEDDDDEESISNSTMAEVKLRKKQRKKFANDIVSLVDLVLPLFLLYKEEREQYTTYINERENTTTDTDVSEVTSGQGEKDKRRPCAIYGAEHLIRFFVKLPSIIAKITPTSESGPSELYILRHADKTREFAYHVNELLVYLQKNVKRVFTDNYFAVER